MQTQPKNILVTGGAGFIGSNLCEELVKRGNNVLCIDNLSTGSQKNIDHLLQSPNFEFLNYDLKDPINLDECREAKEFKIEFYGISEIYHLACPFVASDYDKYAFDTLYANSYVTKNVLDIALKYNSKVFFASSSSVYGEISDQNCFIDENTRLMQGTLSDKSVYDDGKKFSEVICYNYNKLKNVDVKIGRIFPTYGPRMRLLEGLFISDTIMAAMNNKPIKTGYNENNLASFCYVKDLVEGIIAVLENGGFGPYNLGNPNQIKISKIVEFIQTNLNSKSTVEYSEELKNIPIPVIDLVKKKLGWFPFTSLENSLIDTIDYIKATKNSFELNDIFKKDEENYGEKYAEKIKNVEKNKDDENIVNIIFKE